MHLLICMHIFPILVYSAGFLDQVLTCDCYILVLFSNWQCPFKKPESWWGGCPS